MTGFVLAQVQQSVAALFKTDVSRVAERLALPKWVIRTGMAQEQANKMRDALRLAGLVTAVVADDASAAPTQSATASATQAPVASAPSVQAAPASVRVNPTLPISASITQDFEAAGAKSIVQLGATTQVFATPAGGLSADESSTPLEDKPKPAAPLIDLSRFSLAEEGAVMDTRQKAAAALINTGSLSLAAEGVALSEPKLATIKTFDTSALSLDSAPIPEKKPNLLWAELE
jgi:hypothetical protein